MAKKTFLMINRNSQKALQTNAKENGLVVEQSEITYNKNQLWSIIGKNENAKIVNEETNQVLDLVYGATENGTGVHVWENVETTTQFWSIKVASRGYRTIKNMEADKVLDIKDLSIEDGANAQIWEELGGAGQEWKLEEFPKTTKATRTKKSLTGTSSKIKKK